MTGILNTSGHLADNGGTRGHSADLVFPFVLYAQDTFDALGYWILQPNGLRIGPFEDYSESESFAMRLKMFGQLDPDKPETADIIRTAVESTYTYYRDCADDLHSPWRWRIKVGANPDSAAEFTNISGEFWYDSTYKVREVRQDAVFISIGSDPQWQE